MSEHEEILFKGPKGDKGDRGMPSGQRRAIVYLFVLNVALFVVLGLGLVHYVRASQASQVREQAAQRRAAAMIEAKICTDVATMALIKPPAGPPATNPSRAYEQAEHRAWTGLVQGIGCKRTP